MATEALANLGWRETLMAVIALLVFYVAVVFWRMQRLKRSSAVVSVVSPMLAQAAVAAYTVEQVPQALPEPLVESVDSGTAPEPAAPEFPWNEPPPEIPGQQLIDALGRQVYQLRGELATLRAELHLLHEEVRRDQAQAQAVQEQVTHNISPLYSDAMQMAMQGHDATAISQHCGIARAEAELVVALVRNRNDGN